MGYTYFNPQTGQEFSFVTGLTYNLTNPDTNYRNGIDWHLDWGASQFLSKQFLVGAVGYFYDQLTADSGSDPILGPLSRALLVSDRKWALFFRGPSQMFLGLKAMRSSTVTIALGLECLGNSLLLASRAPPPQAQSPSLVTKTGFY